MSTAAHDDKQVNAFIDSAPDLARMEPWQWEVLERVVYYSQKGTEIAAALGRSPATIYKTLALPVFREEMYAEIQRKNMRDSQTRLHKLESRAIELFEEVITYGEIAFPVRGMDGKIVPDKIHRERMSGRSVMKTVNDILMGTGQMGTSARPVTPASIESGKPTGLGAAIISAHAEANRAVIEAQVRPIIGEAQTAITRTSDIPEETEIVTAIEDEEEFPDESGSERISDSL
jgi:hypothetical protein